MIDCKKARTEAYGDMEKAIELLSTQMSITDIAAAVGYLHRNQFISNFRKYSGFTPNDYRRKILIGENADET